MKPKTAAQRKQDERDRMRAEGYVLFTIWVKPGSRARVRKLIARYLPK